ncbi:hypothetical protein DL96DRAFT_1811994 [Flagelloscypha sp. PMI_526]|nr:hypothetical protein DL96DRAFT_1811994 [Flagelloscypha sp. PMI_526]
MSIILITGTQLPPTKASTDGLGKGVRYRSLASPCEYIDLYDKPETFTSLESLDLPHETRLYDPITSTGDAPPAPGAPTLFVVQIELKDSEEGRQEFHQWYEEEHIPLVSNVPGFIRARRVKLESFTGTTEKPNTFVTLYELESPAYMKQPGALAAMATPWFIEVGEKWVIGKVRGLYALEHDY